MTFTDVAVPSEIAVYEDRWNALIACMVEGLPLHDTLRQALDAHKDEAPRVEERASDPVERVAQIKAKVEVLVARYGDILTRITVKLRQNIIYLRGE
jgi:hypothetical protein